MPNNASFFKVRTSRIKNPTPHPPILSLEFSGSQAPNWVTGQSSKAKVLSQMGLDLSRQSPLVIPSHTKLRPSSQNRAGSFKPLPLVVWGPAPTYLPQGDPGEPRQSPCVGVSVEGLVERCSLVGQKPRADYAPLGHQGAPSTTNLTSCLKTPNSGAHLFLPLAVKTGFRSWASQLLILKLS